ncbi:MAG TPA: phosphotransferase family protein [Terriglobales bacterium]|nr:phosphotransferase family protein [Terriglobales bacterium]
MTDPDGIDVPRVTEWLLAHVGGVEPPVRFERIVGGSSNLTFEVTDAGGRRWVLRRPPLSHVLASAHDMGREHRIIAALRPTSVPVPEPLGICADESVNGSPFYVMSHVDGRVLRTAAETEPVLDEAARRRAGEDLVDVLVALHDVDVDAVGLGDLARRDGYVERQLKRWHGQFLRSQAQEREAGIERDVPLVEEVHDLLLTRVPPQQGVVVAHGDYRLDNTIVGTDGSVRAVLDWELCTLGDPLADLGTLMMYWTGADGGAAAATPRPATSLPGFPSRRELAERYAERSGRDIAELGYYVAFGHWRLACILEGVYARFAAGAMGQDRSRAPVVAAQVGRRAEAALRALQAGTEV